MVDVEDDPLVKRRGRKRSKPGPRLERQEVKVERDITILKNPNSFISDLIQERNLFPPDVIKRISTDGGDNSMKMILNAFDKHQDPEISFPGREKKGNLCSGVNRAIILAYCEDLEENYSNLRMIMELLQVLSSFFILYSYCKNVLSLISMSFMLMSLMLLMLIFLRLTTWTLSHLQTAS